MTHICVSKLTIIVSDNGLSPGRCQAIIRTNTGILSIGHLRTNYMYEILIEIYIFSFKKMHLKMSPENSRPFCLGLSVLIRSLQPKNDHYIIVTSWWVRWRLKSPVSPLFAQSFIQGADQRKHQSSASLAFVMLIHRWPMNSPHTKGQ